MYKCATFLLVFLAHCAFCRDFYMGIFRKHDFLVASDTLYKEKRPFQHQVVKYGRLFKCPITYFRITDRLNVGRGPRVQIIRGGLRHKFIVAKVTGGYNLPIAINAYVGCENKKSHKPSGSTTKNKTEHTETTITTTAETNTTAKNTTGHQNTTEHQNTTHHQNTTKHEQSTTTHKHSTKTETHTTKHRGFF